MFPYAKLLESKLTNKPTRCESPGANRSRPPRSRTFASLIGDEIGSISSIKDAERRRSINPRAAHRRGLDLVVIHYATRFVKPPIDRDRPRDKPSPRSIPGLTVNHSHPIRFFSTVPRGTYCIAFAQDASQYGLIGAIPMRENSIEPTAEEYAVDSGSQTDRPGSAETEKNA